MNYLVLIVPAIFALILGRFLYGRFKYGSWTGSFLKGTIASTSGEIPLASALATSQKIQVHSMRDDQRETFVALVVTSRSATGAAMQPYKLSNSQALELAGYLTRAARGGVV